MLGELETAEKILEEAKIHYNPMDFMIIYLNEVPIADGELALARGYPRRAADSMDELVELLRENGVHALLPDALLVKAQAVKAQGFTDQAADILQEARVEADFLGAKMSLWKITAGLAKIEEERGDLASSVAFQQEAREVLTEIADQIDDEKLRAAFTAQPDVGIILQGNQ